MKRKKPCVVTGEVDFGEEVYSCYPGVTILHILCIVVMAMLIYRTVPEMLNESVPTGIVIAILFTAMFVGGVNMLSRRVTVYKEGIRMESFFRSKAIMFKAVENMMANLERGGWVLHIRKVDGKRFARIFGARGTLEMIESSYLVWKDIKKGG